MLAAPAGAARPVWRGSLSLADAAEFGKRRTKRPASNADAGDLASFLDGDGGSNGEEDGAAGRGRRRKHAEGSYECVLSSSPTRRKAVESCSGQHVGWQRGRSGAVGDAHGEEEVMGASLFGAFGMVQVKGQCVLRSVGAGKPCHVPPKQAPLISLQYGPQLQDQLRRLNTSCGYPYDPV